MMMRKIILMHLLIRISEAMSTVEAGEGEAEEEDEEDEEDGDLEKMRAATIVANLGIGLENVELQSTEVKEAGGEEKEEGDPDELMIHRHD